MQVLEFIIKDISDNLYTIMDNDGNEYEFIFEFHGLDFNLSINDTIYMSEYLINKKSEYYSKLYAFGTIDNTYGRSRFETDDEMADIIKIETNDKEIILKRLYG